MKFSNEAKLRLRMQKRGWTDEMILEALQSNMTEQIYIPLLDEGTNVWRPIQAEKIGPDTYRIPARYNPAAEGELWEFPPGATVVCQPRKTADGTILAAVRLASPGRRAV